MSHDHDDRPRRAHDLGGTDQGKFEITEHEPNDFDRRVDALVNLLAHPDVNVVRPDERRRGIEELPEEQYKALSYYQRWLVAVTNVLIEKNVLSADEIEARIDTFKAQTERADESK